MKVGGQHPSVGSQVLLLGDATRNAPLDAYLAEIASVLGDSIPREERESFIEETRTHLEQAIRDGVSRGETLAEATQDAIYRFGKARLNAEDFVQSWFQYRARTPMSRRLGRANLIAYGFFQIAVVLYYLVLQLNVFLPSEAMYRIPWRMSPLQIREVWPEPLPFPDFTPAFFVTIGWPILAPIVAGWLVGRLVPVRAAAAVYRGLTPLIIVSFVMGALLLPMTQGLLFALFQVVFWLPAGCLSAHLASHMVRAKSKAKAA